MKENMKTMTEPTLENRVAQTGKSDTGEPCGTDEEEFRFDALRGVVCVVWGYAIMGFIALIIVIGIMALTGCTTTEYVPVETVKTEHHYHTDSVKQVDTVFTERETIIREADSALVAELGLQLKANERAILVLKRELERKANQTIERAKDTIREEKEVQVPYPVEKKLTRWQTFCCDYGKLMLGGTVIGFVLFMLWLLRWIRNKR